MKVAHIYADSNSHNSGDVILSISTKKYFEEIILDKQNIEYTNICCRDKEFLIKII